MKWQDENLKGIEVSKNYEILTYHLYNCLFYYIYGWNYQQTFFWVDLEKIF